MVKKGLVIYDIEMGGCLNGVYTNELTSPPGRIYNEIARRVDGQSIERGIAGDYVTAWIDIDPPIVNGTLSITESTPGILQFEWRSSEGNYSGVGYKMNPRQIAVRYQQI